MSFTVLIIIGIIFGIGFGFFIQRAGFCLAAGFGELFMGRGKRILRLLIIVFIISSIGFLVSGYYDSSLGLKRVGEIRGFGFYNLLSGLLFGAGIILSGGCILGTLRQIGEGNMTFLVVLASIIPGMAIVVFFLNPMMQDQYFITSAEGVQVKNLLISELIGVEDYWVTIILVILALFWYSRIRGKRKAA